MKGSIWTVSILFIFIFSFIQSSDQFTPLRDREPLKPSEIEALVFGMKFWELDKESECHIDIDIQWTTAIGGGKLPNIPLIGDFRNDGKKEIAIAAANEYVEVIEAENGNKEPGWPFYLPDRVFSTGPIDYDLTGGSARDLMVATNQGEIIFLNDEGLPYHGATLKVPNYVVNKFWYTEFISNDQTPYEPLFRDIPDTAARRRECDESTRKYIDYYKNYKKVNEANMAKDREYVEKFKNALADHVNEQTRKVDAHIKQIEKLFTARKLRQLDDDLEDERGARALDQSKKTNDAVHTFDGVEGWLTREGVESLELFLPTETGASYLTTLRSSVDPLYSPQLENYLAMNKIAFDEEKQLSLSPSFASHPIVVDLEGDGHNEIIIAVNYNANVSARVHPGYYAACAIVCFDMMIHQIKWISHLEMSSLASGPNHFQASISSSPTIIDVDGDGFLNIVVGTMMGNIFVLDNFGVPIKGFPISMGPLIAPVVAEDVDEDGALELIAVDTTSTLAVFNAKGHLKWDVLLSHGCTAAPAIADINNDGYLDIVNACESGIIHVTTCNGENLAPFPIITESGRKATPTLVQLNDNFHFHIITLAGSGHLYLTDGVSACTEIIDVGEGSNLAAPMVVADDITGNGKLDLLVISGFRYVTCLSTDTEFHPLKDWSSPSHHRNVYTTNTHQGIYFLKEFREHRDVVGDSFVVQFEIVDNRNNQEKSYYDVQIKLRRDLDPLFSERFTEPGVYSAEIKTPNARMRGTLRIEMTNEHKQFFTDSISLTFNLRFFASIKYLLVVPFALCAFFVFYLKREFEQMII